MRTAQQHRADAEWHRQAATAWQADTQNRPEVRAAWVAHCHDMAQFHDRCAACVEAA